MKKISEISNILANEFETQTAKEKQFFCVNLNPCIERPITPKFNKSSIQPEDLLNIKIKSDDRTKSYFIFDTVYKTNYSQDSLYLVGKKYNGFNKELAGDWYLIIKKEHINGSYNRYNRPYYSSSPYYSETVFTNCSVGEFSKMIEDSKFLDKTLLKIQFSRKDTSHLEALGLDKWVEKQVA